MSERTPDSPRVFSQYLMDGELGRRMAMEGLGGAEGIRTPDLRSAIAALSQLSYSPARTGDCLRILPANVAAIY